MNDESEIEAIDRSDMDLLYKALKAAQEAFEKVFDDEGLDGAFWELAPLEGWVLSCDFERMHCIVYDVNYGQRKEMEKEVEKDARHNDV